MAENKHGLLGKVIKVLMVVVFMLIGAAILAFGILGMTKYKGEFENWKAISICNIVFGCLLLTSPFFLSHKREGLNKVLKFIFTIIFVLIGIALIVLGAVYRGKGWDIGTDYNVKWLSICNIVFGCLLLTSPYFLKKDVK